MKFWWHLHHDSLVEPCYDAAGRVKFIKTSKPQEEQELRLRLFKPVMGELPSAYDQAGAAYDQARAAYLQAWAAYLQAGAAYDQAGAAYLQAWAAYDQARAAYLQARAAYHQARAAYHQSLEDNLPAILSLHALECPQCPWDGVSIFKSQGQ